MRVLELRSQVHSTFWRCSQHLSSGSWAVLLVGVAACGTAPEFNDPELELATRQQALITYTDGALFRENFEYNNWTFDAALLTHQTYTTNGVDGRILRATYKPSVDGSERIGEAFELNQEVDSATLSFDFKLHSEFEFVKGGKMHGLGGGTRTTGCAAINPGGWSVRMMWRAEGVPELYIYHQNRQNDCGDHFPASNFNLERSRWYRVDLYVDLNSSPSTADGKTRLYIDGVKRAEATGLVLSGDADVKIDSFMVSTFFGGSNQTYSPSKTTYAYFDNFTVNPGERVSGTQGTTCELRREGIYNKSSNVCCDDACGACGGSGCSGLPGGSSNCCTGTILNASANCASVSAPCKF